MEHVISIHKSGQTIDLEPGSYKIDVLGGWGVSRGQFSISFVHRASGQKIDCEKTFWSVQSFAFNKRSKRIFIANITEAGTYTVEFIKPETLTVKHSNLFFTGLFQDPIPNDEIFVYIH